MKEDEQKRYSVALVVMGLACGVALAVSWSSYRAVKLSPVGSAALSELRGEIELLDSRILTLRKRVDGMKNVADMIARGQENGFHPSRRSGGPPAMSGGLAGVETDRLERLEALLASGGVEAVSEMEPEVLSDIQQDYQRRKAAAEYHKRVRVRHQEQVAADEAKFGSNKLSALYEKAKSSTGEGNSALEVLLTEYPEANATGMALAERALEAALSSDTAAVEQYYQALTESGSFNDIVTDMGIEAVPTVQTYLINQYISEGRFDEAEAILKSMSTDFTDSYIADVGQGGEPRWVPVDDVVKGVSSAIDQIKSGDTSTLMGGPGGGPGGGNTGGTSGGAGGFGGGSGPGGGGFAPPSPGGGR